MMRFDPALDPEPVFAPPKLRQWHEFPFWEEFKWKKSTGRRRYRSVIRTWK